MGIGCKLFETYGNLLEAPRNQSLAHCVAEDMRMGSGIAVNFRRKFGHVGELLDQCIKVGGVAVLKLDGRCIFYLVTKLYSYGKPELNDLFSSLKEMRFHCERENIKYLSIPKLGCGLDRLTWNEVKTAILEAFTGLNIKINPKSYYFKRNAVYIERCNYNLTAFFNKAVILLFGTEDSHFMSASSVHLLKGLNEYRNYLRLCKMIGHNVEIRHARIQPIFGLIVKETSRDDFSYANFETCLLELCSEIEERHIQRIAFEEFGDKITMEKVITVIKHVFENTEIKVFICKKPYYQNPSFVPSTYSERRYAHPYKDRYMTIFTRGFNDKLAYAYVTPTTYQLCSVLCGTRRTFGLPACHMTAI
ncbi:hypothetical protein C0J52_01173 [Blattella germanica]|nr:hypothetical protein C0J52_01173 [Blattella germanica]